MDLSDAFFGDADDLSDFFERERVVFDLLPVEALTDDGLFDVGEVCEVSVDDVFEFDDEVIFDGVAAFFAPVGFFEIGLELDGEAGAVPAVLLSGATEGLEDGAAGVGGEFESSIDVEFFDGAEEGHVAFADDLGEVDVAEAGSFGHGENECEVGADEVFAEVLTAGVPEDHFLGGLGGEALGLDFSFEEFESSFGEIEPEEHDAFFGSGHELRGSVHEFGDFFACGLIPGDFGELREGLCEEVLFDGTFAKLGGIHESDVEFEQGLDPSAKIPSHTNGFRLGRQLLHGGHLGLLSILEFTDPKVQAR